MNPDNFSIRTKLALLVGLFLVPVSSISPKKSEMGSSICGAPGRS